MDQMTNPQRIINRQFHSVLLSHCFGFISRNLLVQSPCSHSVVAALKTHCTLPDIFAYLSKLNTGQAIGPTWVVWRRFSDEDVRCFLALFCAVGKKGAGDERDRVLPTEGVWWGHGGQERQWQDQSEWFCSFVHTHHIIFLLFKSMSFSLPSLPPSLIQSVSHSRTASPKQNVRTLGHVFVSSHKPCAAVFSTLNRGEISLSIGGDALCCGGQRQRISSEWQTSSG